MTNNKHPSISSTLSIPIMQRFSEDVLKLRKSLRNLQPRNEFKGSMTNTVSFQQLGIGINALDITEQRKISSGGN